MYLIKCFNLNKLYLATIKFKSNKEIGQWAILNSLSLNDFQSLELLTKPTRYTDWF